MIKMLLLSFLFSLSAFFEGAQLFAQQTLLRPTISSGSVSSGSVNNGRFMATVGEAFISSGGCLRIGAQPGVLNASIVNPPCIVPVATKNVTNLIQASIAPNPTNGEMTVTINQEVDRDYKVELVDLLGQTLYEKFGLSIGSNKLSFSQIPAGTYALLIKNNQGAIQFSKLIIKTNQ